MNNILLYALLLLLHEVRLRHLSAASHRPAASIPQGSVTLLHVQRDVRTPC